MQIDHSTNDSVADTLANFVVSMRDIDLPESVIEFAGAQILDTLGVAVAARRLASDKAAVEVANKFPRQGGAHIVGQETTVDLPFALLANGTLAHALDFDNTHMSSMTHVGAAVAPTSWTLGSMVKATGADVVRSYVAGVECVARLGSAVPGAFHERGFHATSVVGIFGAVAAAGLLLGASRDQIQNAFGIAGSMSAGLLEYHTAGSSNKRLHPGIAASQAYVAMQLAMSGADGPSTVFEGPFGLHRTHLGDVKPDFALDTLGEMWQTDLVTIKPYPVCNLSHAALDCVRLIHQREDDLDWHSIQRIDVYGPRQIVPLVVEPVQTKLTPRSPYEAKFSLQHCVARMVIDRQITVDHFGAAMVAGGEIQELSKKVIFHPEDEPNFPRELPGRVVLTIRGGQRIQAQVADTRGSPQLPLSMLEITEKFHANVDPAFGTEATRAIADGLSAIWDLRSIESVVARFSAQLTSTNCGED